MRFFLIDRITRWEPGRAAEAVKNVALSEDFFDDHFPRRPVMPGALILEGMAQLSGLLLEAGLRAESGWLRSLLGMEWRRVSGARLGAPHRRLRIIRSSSTRCSSGKMPGSS